MTTRWSDPHRLLGPPPGTPDETWKVPVLAQVARMTLDDGIIARAVAALGSPDRPVGLDRARIERLMRDLAPDPVARRIDDSVYLGSLGQFRVDLATLDATPRGDLAAKRAVHWAAGAGGHQGHRRRPRGYSRPAPRDLRAHCRRGSLDRRGLPDAVGYANGLAVALPQVVMARPTGVGRASATYEIPIEGRDEWLAAARRLA